MADKLTAIRIKQGDGYGPQIPIKANAENIIYKKHYNIEEILGNVDTEKGDLQKQINDINNTIVDTTQEWLDEHYISPTVSFEVYDPTKTYQQYDYVIYKENNNQNLYICISNTPQPAGDWDSAKWQLIDLTIQIPTTAEVPIDETLSLSGQAADAKAVGDLIKINQAVADTTKLAFNTSSDLVNIPTMDDIVRRPIENGQYDDGEQGQLLRSNGDGTTAWVDEGLPSDDQVQTVVNAWMDQHSGQYVVPDNSLTYEKLVNGTLGFVTPEMFGAAGNGGTNERIDDTNAVRNALKYSIDNGIKLLLDKTYYITSSLLTSSDYDGTIVIDIEGTRPLKNYIYAIDNYGGIEFQNDINIFEGVTIQGSIYRVSFMPRSRSQTGSIFKNCSLRAFSFNSCSVSNILAFCHNTNVGAVSQIINSRFLTVYYFAKCDSENNTYRCTDSKITGNYINGGSELTENHCFEWISFNGSCIVDNFIDFYQTIYYPNANTSFAFQGGVSVGNQYQVFRYLYFKTENCTKIFFSSSSDCFNSINPDNDPTDSKILTKYEKYSYVGHDGNTYDYPPCIMIIDQTNQISIKNAIIQQGCANLVFIRAGLTGYSYATAELTLNDYNHGRNKFNYSSYVTHAGGGIYNGGSYKLNSIKLPFILECESLPSISFGWINYYIGQLIRVNNKIYKFVAIYENDAYAATWVDVTAYI